MGPHRELWVQNSVLVKYMQNHSSHVRLNCRSNIRGILFVFVRAVRFSWISLQCVTYSLPVWFTEVITAGLLTTLYIRQTMWSLECDLPRKCICYHKYFCSFCFSLFFYYTSITTRYFISCKLPFWPFFMVPFGKSFRYLILFLRLYDNTFKTKTLQLPFGTGG